MKRVSQKDAVFSAVISVLKENGVEFMVNQDTLSDVLDKDLRMLIINNLINKFKTGAVVLSKGYNDKELKSYVGGLVNNWTKKDMRLNGGITHTIQQPGSRIGQTDPMAKELRKMLIATKGTPNEAIVKKELIKRQEQLRKEQAASIIIDKTHIPEALHHLLD